MLPFIKAENITVVTDGLEIANILTEMDIQTILVGGFIKPKHAQ